MNYIVSCDHSRRLKVFMQFSEDFVNMVLWSLQGFTNNQWDCLWPCSSFSCEATSLEVYKYQLFDTR